VSKKVLNIYILASSVVVIVIIVSFFISWKVTHINNMEEYNKWLNEINNKCIVTRQIAGVKISVKYQPPLYIVMKDRISESVHSKIEFNVEDSLITQQSKMLTFLMTIGPDKDVSENKQAASIMSEGVNGYNEYVNRVLTTNFFMEQHISLYVDGIKYTPVLSGLENLYELAEQRTFVVVFISEGKSNINDGDEFIFEFNDPYFHMGKVQFPFSNKDFAQAKKLKISFN
jgi:hypothetical protein